MCCCIEGNLEIHSPVLFDKVAAVSMVNIKLSLCFACVVVPVFLPLNAILQDAKGYTTPLLTCKVIPLDARIGFWVIS